MEELKTVEIELISLKNDSTLIIVEYLNEKNEPCIRTDKLRTDKSQALKLTGTLKEAFEKYDPNIDIYIKLSL